MVSRLKKKYIAIGKKIALSELQQWMDDNQVKDFQTIFDKISKESAKAGRQLNV